MRVHAYLASLGVSPATYLRRAKVQATAKGYDSKYLEFATDATHKLKYDGVPFGATGHKDFILHKILHGEPDAKKRRDAYHARAAGVMRRTRNKYSAASLAYNILW